MVMKKSIILRLKGPWGFLGVPSMVYCITFVSCLKNKNKITRVPIIRDPKIENNREFSIRKQIPLIKHAVRINAGGVIVTPGDAHGIIAQGQDFCRINVLGDFLDVHLPLACHF